MPGEKDCCLSCRVALAGELKRPDRGLLEGESCESMELSLGAGDGELNRLKP